MEFTLKLCGVGDWLDHPGEFLVTVIADPSPNNLHRIVGAQGTAAFFGATQKEALDKALEVIAREALKGGGE